VPKIETNTIAEQREWRRRSLIEAAAELAIESSGRVVTISAVARRAGVSRTAIYEYFASSSDLIAEIIMTELAEYAKTLNSSCQQHFSPEAKIEAWVRTSLEYISDGRHLLAKSINATSLPESREQEVALAHRQLVAPLHDSLKKLGLRDVTLAVELIRKATDVAATRIESGAPATEEINDCLTFVMAGLTALSTLSSALPAT
jgi:AcrR family transcriptional regulator